MAEPECLHLGFSELFQKGGMMYAVKSFGEVQKRHKWQFFTAHIGVKLVGKCDEGCLCRELRSEAMSSLWEDLITFKEGTELFGDYFFQDFRENW